MTPIEPANILRHELIGLQVHVLASSQDSLSSFRGTVLGETMKTLTIGSELHARVVAKHDCLFSFRLRSGCETEVDGRYLVCRPEDRVKKRSRQYERRVYAHWKK